MSAPIHNSLPPTGIYQLMPSYRMDDIPTSSVHDTSYQNEDREHACLSINAAIGGAASLQHASPIEIWDVKKGFPGDLLTPPYARDAYAYVCNQNISIIDRFARNHLNRYLIQNGRHLIKAFINDSSVGIGIAHWSHASKSIHYDVGQAGSHCSPAGNFDITAHELGHAVVHYTSRLTYSGQSGALNESFADIFAIMAQHCRNSTFANDPAANWNIAEGLLLNTQQGTAIRSMSNPGSAFRGHSSMGDDSQTSHINQYQPLPYDNGGVHIFSGIPNKAFYLAAKEIGGFSWEKAGKIWYEALRNATKNDDFSDFACRTMAAVQDLKYGPQIYHYVGKAWQDVGVDLRRHVRHTDNNTPSKSLQNLEEAISLFSKNDGQARNLFRLVCQHQPDAEYAVYKNLWDLKGSRKDVCYEYGRFSFNDINGYCSSSSEKFKVLEKYKKALSEYETISYEVPGKSIGEKVIRCIEDFPEDCTDCIEEYTDCIEKIVNTGKDALREADLALRKVFFG